MATEHSNHSTIAVKTVNGLVFIKEVQIIYCEAQGNYTYLHLDNSNHTKITISKPLNTVLDTLSSKQFCRIHQSFAVNLAHVLRYDSTPKNCVTMINGISLPVSRSRKGDFLDGFNIL